MQEVILQQGACFLVLLSCQGDKTFKNAYFKNCPNGFPEFPCSLIGHLYIFMFLCEINIF